MSGTGLGAGNEDRKLRLLHVVFATKRCVSSEPLGATASGAGERVG